MAKESKFIEVKPDEVQETVDLWQKFGWELLGAPQTIFNKTVRDGDSHTDSAGNTRTQVITETIHYVKISFQRDKSMPHYEELCNLESQYYNVSYDGAASPEYVEEPSFGCFFALISIVPTIIGLLILLTGTSADKPVSLIFLVPGLAILIWRFKSTSAKKAIWEKYEAEHSVWVNKRNSEIASKKSNILKQAEALLS